MLPAQNLGHSFSTYVVWLISPDGEILKAGELLRNGDSGILHTITNWGAFGIFITAEPDNCGTCPSTVVLASDVCVSGLRSERWATIVCGNLANECRGKRTPLPGETR
jgi:hypothetical protein